MQMGRLILSSKYLLLPFSLFLSLSALNYSKLDCSCAKTPPSAWIQTQSEGFCSVGTGYIWLPRWAGLVSRSSWIYLVMFCKMLVYTCGIPFDSVRVYLVC